MCAGLGELAFINHNILIMGDLNFHLDNKPKSDARLFNTVFMSLEFRHSVTGATHKDGYKLDVVISRETELHYSSILGNKRNLLGDHMAVMFLINMDKTIHP